MSVAQDHVDMVVSALRCAPPAGDAAWFHRTLGRATGLQAGAVRAAVTSLRRAGKIHFTNLVLSPSMLVEACPKVAASMPMADDSASTPSGRKGSSFPEGVKDGPEGASAGPEGAQIEAVLAEVARTPEDLARIEAGRVTGPELYAEIDEWCRENGVSHNRFCELAGRGTCFVRTIGAAKLPRIDTVIAARETMGRPLPATVMDAIRAKVPTYRVGRAERLADATRAREALEARREAVQAEYRSRESRQREVAAQEARAINHKINAARTPMASHKAAPVAIDVVQGLSAGHQMQAMMIDSVEDTMAFVRRAWPDVWQRVIEAPRALKMGPAPAMMHVIEAGLDQVAAT